jgi:hypothetical protein
MCSHAGLLHVLVSEDLVDDVVGGPVHEHRRAVGTAPGLPTTKSRGTADVRGWRHLVDGLWRARASPNLRDDLGLSTGGVRTSMILASDGRPS